MTDKPSIDTAQSPMLRIAEGSGTLEEREEWLTELKRRDPYFNDPELEEVLQAERESRTIHPNDSGQLTKNEMIKMVERIWHLMENEGGEREEMACRLRLRKCIYNPRLDDIITCSYQVKSSEDVVEEALAHQPIALGPISHPETT